jgi:iron complex outermembrane receptor protein
MKIFNYIIFTLIAFNAMTQARPPIILSGNIRDAAANTSLAGASIHFIEARIGAIADSNGNYTVRNIPSGHHLIEISHTGYNNIVEHIDIVSSMQKNFSLTSAIIENQGVTVTGVTTATSTRSIPIPIRLIRKADLMQTPSTNIIDALSKQPGISQIGTGPAISKPVIRGLSYNRVVVVNDGIRQEGQQWGDEHGIEIDELSINRAEILKGPASIMYGSDALAGVIHFITNIPAPEGTIRGNLFSSYQTNNGLIGLNANLQGNQNGFNWNIYGSRKSAKDYENKWDGRVLNSRFNEKNYGGYIGLNKSWGFSHLILSNFDQSVGLIEGDRDDASGAFLVNTGSPLERIATSSDLNSRKLFLPNQRVQHYKLISDNSIGIGKNRLKMNVGWQKNKREEFGNPEEPDERELSFDLNTINYNLQWRFPDRGDLETTLGITGMQQNNKNSGEEVIIPEYNSNDLGAFAFLQKTFKTVTMSGGLRYDNRTINSKEFLEDGDIKFTPFKKSYSNLSGSLGASYYPSAKITLKANLARGFRAPSLSELASNGAHEGTNRYEYGQLGLKSERSLQFDAGIEGDYEHISFSLSSFYNRIKDFIFYSRLQNQAGGDSIISIDDEDLEAFRYSQNNARLSGFEASIDIHPHPLDWLHFENTFSVVRGRFDQSIDGSKNLPFIPAARLISQLRANFTKTKQSFRNFYVHVEVDNTFEQNKPFFGYNTETATKGYSLLNAGLGADINNGKTTLFSIHLAANNLLDKAYQNHLNRLKYTAINNATGRIGVFNMGRNFSIKINVPFNISTTRKNTDQ